MTMSTSRDTVEVKFECKICGGTALSLPDEYTDESMASCKKCGQEFGTFGEVKAKAMQTVNDGISQRVRDAFKGSKGWKLR